MCPRAFQLATPATFNWTAIARNVLELYWWSIVVAKSLLTGWKIFGFWIEFLKKLVRICVFYPCILSLLFSPLVSSLSEVLHSALSDYSLTRFTCCLLPLLICISFLSLVFPESPVFRSFYPFVATVVLPFSISHTFAWLSISWFFLFPRCSPLLPCYPSLSVFFKPQYFSLSLLVRHVLTCYSVCTCPIFLPPVLAYFSHFLRFCPFCNFMFFDPCLDFRLLFGFLVVSWITLSASPLISASWVQQNCWVRVGIFVLSSGPSPDSQLFCSMLSHQM